MSDKRARHYRRWTEEEVDQLKDLWGVKSLPEIAKKLKRTELSITNKVTVLQLGAWSMNSDKISLFELYKVINPHKTGGGYLDFVRLITLHGAPIIEKRIKNAKTKMIGIDDFWKWAKKHQHILNFSKFEENMLGAEPKWVAAKRRNDALQRIRKRVWTTIDENRLTHMVNKGYCLRRIAKELNRTTVAVRKRLYMLGLDNPEKDLGYSRRWTKEENDRLVDLYNSGHSIDSISELLNRRPVSVQSHISHMRGRPGMNFNLSGFALVRKARCI